MELMLNKINITISRTTSRAKLNCVELRLKEVFLLDLVLFIGCILVKK
jgi:hypothetical protein